MNLRTLDLNLLLVFDAVYGERSISRAAVKLHLSQPTISTQLKTLEESLGQKLFQRQGRKLVLADVGQATPLDDAALEQRLAELMVQLLKANHAPPEAFRRLRLA